MPHYVSIRQASEIAGVARRTIYNWIAKKIVEVKYTPSGKTVINSESLQLKDKKNVTHS